MPELESLFSANANNMKKSIIRELLKLIAEPDIISFAGGLPDPQTFPVEDLRLAAERVFLRRPTEALQYGTTEGDDELKDQLIAFEAREGIEIGREKHARRLGEPAGHRLVCKVFLDPGDMVVAGQAHLSGRDPGDPVLQGRGPRRPLRLGRRRLRHGRAALALRSGPRRRP